MTRIAVAHDYLTQRGGAERVSLNLLDVFPGAALYTSLYDAESTYPEFRDADIRTSPLDRVGFFRSHFRAALPFFPWAFDHTPVDPGTDVIVVSTTGFAHGIRTTGRKVVYCHSPARFLYLTDEYLGGRWWRKPTGWALMVLRPMLRRWDRRAARSADAYLCNSTLVRDRIKRIYGIECVYAGPLFVHQFPHVWIDFRGIRDTFMAARGIDYFENSRRATHIHRQYAIRNPLGWAGYGADCWGLSAGRMDVKKGSLGIPFLWMAQGPRLSAAPALALRSG